MPRARFRQQSWVRGVTTSVGYEYVLSDPQIRAICNQHGEEGLKDMPPPGSSRPSYGNGTGGPTGPDCYNKITALRKPPPIESKLPCILEELYTSSTRKMEISRTIVNASGQQAQESEILTIDVKPGWKKGTKITFLDKGNEQQNQLQADLVFVI
ncbi:hypothetical protein Gotur_013692 [Gossypium turneri]